MQFRTLKASSQPSRTSGSFSEGTYEWHFQRGFVDAVGMDFSHLRQFGEQLFAVAPVRRLTLTGLRGGVESLRHLGCGHHLTSLNLCASALTNESLDRLARDSRLKGVRELGLLFNRLDDDAVSALCETRFFQELAWLRLGANPFTEDGRHRLQALFGPRVSLVCDRDKDHLYAFQDHRGFHPGFGNEFTQILPMGSATAMRLAVFDHEGNLLGIESRPVEYVWPDWERHYRNLDAVRESWLIELGFASAPIRVKRFRFSDEEGINDFNWWQDTFASSDHPQRGEFQDGIERWYAEGQFEWDYGDDNCWLDRSGEVTDS